jgi:hypothetical protein
VFFSEGTERTKTEKKVIPHGSTKEYDDVQEHATLVLPSNEKVENCEKCTYHFLRSGVFDPRNISLDIVQALHVALISFFREF